MPEHPYYLADFHSVLCGVERLYAPLLDAAEHAHIGRFKSLSQPAQQLYVRLVNRKGPFFRIRRLHYPEIEAPDAALAELAAQRLLRFCEAPPPAARLQRLLACFTLPELRLALRGHLAPYRAGRVALLEWLAGWDGLEGWTTALLQKEKLVELPENDPWPFLRFLFFGELRDNLADFVIRDLGHVRTEAVAPETLRPCFTHRREAEDAYEMATRYETFRQIRDLLPANALLEWWRGQAVSREALAGGRQWFDRLIARLGRRLERERLPEAALELYATSPVAPARERQARLLILKGQTAAAATLLRAMQDAPCNPQEAYAARQLLARLQARSRAGEAHLLQKASRAIRLPYAPRGGAAASGETVEAAVLAHYRAAGWQGVHAENWLWNASFGLLLWDIIYDPAYGVFHSPLQYAPSDLHTPEFYSRRQKAIETRLQALHQPAQAAEIISRHFVAKQGIANPFVAWHADLPEILTILINRVPAAAHAAVLRQMARNPRHHAHGFADLFIWTEQDYRFIEIKSRNDRLAAHQYEWLRFFTETGINVSLEKVERASR